MIKTYDFLSPDECEIIVNQLQKSNEWHDGKVTAGDLIKNLKQNKQLNNTSKLFEKIKKLWNERLASNTLKKIHKYTLSNIVLPPCINKYNVGDFYNWHFDKVYLQPSVMTDFSYTLFFNADYEGGELQIEDTIIKGKQGQLIIYDSNLRHQVKKVTKGVRYAGVGWISSLIRDSTARKIISNNETALESANLDSLETIALQKSNALLWKTFG